MQVAAQLEAARAERDRLRAACAHERRVREIVLERLLAGWWIFDVTADTFTFSAGLRERLGLSLDAPIPEPIAHCLRTLIEEHGPDRFEARADLPAGTHVVPVIVRAEAMAWDAAGTPTRWRGGNLDLERLHRAERLAQNELAAQAERLASLNLELAAQAEKLERSNAALEDFAYAASHDLQVPLRAIAHFAEWIDEDLPANSGGEVREHVARLLNRVERLSQLHADLLAYAQVGHTPIDWRASEPVRAVYDSWARVGEPHMQLVVTGDADACLVPIAQLSAILDQLLSNAVRHHDRPDGRIQARVRHADDTLYVEIEDDGPGIEPRFAAQAFKVLETLRPRDAGAGSGVGLPIARTHARRAGGEVALVERDGRGALFTVCLPVRPLR